MISTDKKVEVVVKVGSGINKFIVHVVAWMEKTGNIQVQLSPEKNGTPSNEELALRMLQRDPSSVLRQVNKALHAAGVGVDVNAELLESKVIPGPNVPLHKNDPRLTPEFLATLVVAARTYGWSADSVDVDEFVKTVFGRAGVEVPHGAFLEPFTLEQIDEAEQTLDGTAPTIDGVMPQVVSSEVH